jgi:hypothetical protein
VLILIFKEYELYKSSNQVKQYCMTVYIFLFVTLIHTTYDFLKIFYEIIRSE